ncbi:hypothetical protein CR513_43402, partial [Mucuna pruriens]
MSDVRSFHGLEESQERAFQALKDRLTHAPILALPNFAKSFDQGLESVNTYLLPKEFVVYNNHEFLKHLGAKNKLNK